jgi:dihydroxyacid dehydratase/phosphogluconate dehydratase
VHYYPRQEFLHGLHLASSLKSGRKHIFANKEAAMMAYKRGEIDASDIVVIGK